MVTNECKTCSKCKTSKLKSEFYKSPGYRDGFHSWCKECAKAARRLRGTAKTDPVMRRRQKLKSKYGMTIEQYDAVLLSQDGKCKGCGRSAATSTVAFCVDHDHSCCPGKTTCGVCVRGILCSNCNAALGMVNDNPETLRSLIQYLST